MNALIVLCMLVCLISANATLNTTVEAFGVQPAVSSVDVKSYVGLWYQMYADAVVIDTIEKNSFCDTALYGLNNDGSISVRNYAKIGSPTGDDYVITGYAYQAKGMFASFYCHYHCNQTPSTL